MDDDTPQAPESSGQPPEPTPEPTPTPEPEPPPTPEPTPPPPTPEQIAEMASEKAFQKIASWQGRRDKDLFDNLGNLIDTKIRGAAPQPEQPRTDPATVLENPDAWLRNTVPKILHDEVARITKQDQEFNSELIRNAAATMDSDALFKGEEGQKLGNAVVAEIQKNFNSVDRNVNPAVAARLLVSDAVVSVMRQNIGKKENPLAGNRPVAGPMGTVKPPVSGMPKAKPPKLSESASALAKRWNYSAEDIARVFGEQ